MIRSRFNTYDNRKSIDSISKYDNNQGYINFIKSRSFLESLACSCSVLVEEMEKAALTGDLDKIDELTLSYFTTALETESFFLPNLRKQNDK